VTIPAVASDTPPDLVEAYGARYAAGDADGIADLCEAPLVAVRDGEVVHLPDRAAVVAHFQGLIDGYRGSGAASFGLDSVRVQPLGERSCVTTAAWRVLDTDGQLLRERVTSYHLVAGEAGWRVLSYINHDA
jgi:hypothetical protein